MIGGDTTFHRAETVSEAVEAWHAARERGGRPIYYAGGTEVVTLARDGRIAPTDVVDIKSIPETREIVETQEPVGTRESADATKMYALGAAATLNEIVERGGSSVLARCSAGVADRTARNSITLGGNICGMLPYRESVLPFLLLEGEVELAGAGGTRRAALRDLFRKRLLIDEGEFAVRFFLDRAATADLERSGLWYYRRRTSDPRVDYPVTTTVMAIVAGELRVAVSGTWGYPYRATEAEAVYRQVAGDAALRTTAERMVDAVPIRVKEDMRAGSTYRRELTIQAITDGLEAIRRTGFHNAETGNGTPAGDTR